MGQRTANKEVTANTKAEFEFLYSQVDEITKQKVNEMIIRFLEQQEIENLYRMLCSLSPEKKKTTYTKIENIIARERRDEILISFIKPKR